MEGGYGNTAAEVVSNIKKLAGIGVAGINIEDSAVKENLRSIIPGSEFAQKLSAICTQLKKEQVDVFINVRCDAFLLDLAEARQEALARIASYEKAGADGIFLPCITDPEDIGAAVNATKLPLNVMCMPNLPDFDTLQSLGVKRISMGNFVNGAVYKHLEEISGTIARQKNFSAVFH
jgi:2-methylisocitrate lyase-like PEP mutase family enzyme